MNRKDIAREIDFVDSVMQNRFCDYGEETHRALQEAVELIKQEPKTGHWISMEVSSGRDSWKCSVCGRRARGKLKNLPYCHCGAKMSEIPTGERSE